MLFASGILLGITILVSALSIHFGPHSHFISLASSLASITILGILIATQGGSETIYFILGIDLAISLGIGLLLKHSYTGGSVGSSYRKPFLTAGLAVSDLNPVGVVQAGGEMWSATSMSGIIKAGSQVEIISSTPVRLEVVAKDYIADPFPTISHTSSSQDNLSDNAQTNAPIDNDN